MNFVCYTCEDDNCQTQFAIDSMSDTGVAMCPNCGGDTVNTKEVIVNPHVLSWSQAQKDGYI